jgi:hypothetical protein
MDFYDIIRESHSGIRWLVVIVWVVVVLRYLLAWLTNPNKYLSFDRIIYSVFTGLLDLNVLLGLTLLVLRLIEGTSRLNLWFHMGLLLFAAVVAHLASRRMKALLENEPKEKFFIGWASALFVGLLIVVGVSLIPGAWGF